MTLRESIPNIDQWDVKILASDIDTNMIATGMQGEYPDHMAEHIPRPLLLKYTSPVKGAKGAGVQMHPSLRSLIHFNPLNLLEAWPMRQPFDVIFCRNVVIYFDKPTQKTLFARFAEVLKTDGWFYIGHSENIGGNERFRLLGQTIHQKVR